MRTYSKNEQERLAERDQRALFAEMRKLTAMREQRAAEEASKPQAQEGDSTKPKTAREWMLQRLAEQDQLQLAQTIQKAADNLARLEKGEQPENPLDLYTQRMRRLKQQRQ